IRLMFIRLFQRLLTTHSPSCYLTRRMWICRCLRRRRQKAVKFIAFFDKPVPKGGTKMPITTSCSTAEKVRLVAIPADDNKMEVKSEEPVVFTVSSPSGTVTLAPNSPNDGVSAFVIP